jgi:hypothetical protein
MVRIDQGRTRPGIRTGLGAGGNLSLLALGVSSATKSFDDARSNTEGVREWVAPTVMLNSFSVSID